MINKVAKGSRVERKCYDDLKSDGYKLLWKTIRHKFLNIDLFHAFDILAANKEHLRFIQVKTKYIPNETRKLLRKIKLPENCYKEIWAWEGSRDGINLWRKEVIK